MFKNQLQELAQRSCCNLPSYSCIREGPDHAPRFRAAVAFNGETFESPHFFATLRQAEHAAAELALNVLSKRGPPHSLASRILDETAGRKNLLQESAQRIGINLPNYTTVKSGPSHLLVFTSTVQIAGLNFKGEPAKSKKQAEKNAAMAAWSALKQLGSQDTSSSELSDSESNEEQEHRMVSRALLQACRENISPETTVATEGYQTGHSQTPRRNSEIPGKFVNGSSYETVLPPLNQLPPSSGSGSVVPAPGRREMNNLVMASTKRITSASRPNPAQHRTATAFQRDAYGIPLSRQWKGGGFSGQANRFDSSESHITNLPFPIPSSNHILLSHFQLPSLDAQVQFFPQSPFPFHPMPFLVPPVTVRPVVPLHSTPPRLVELDDHLNAECNEESAARQGLSRLQL